MRILDKKDNFFSIALKAGEKYVIADDKGAVILSFVVDDECIISSYRKTEVMPLSYQ